MSAFIFQAQLTVGNMSNMALFFVGTSIMGMMGTIPWSLWALVTVGPTLVILGTLIFMGTVNIVCTMVIIGSDGPE